MGTMFLQEVEATVVLADVRDLSPLAAQLGPVDLGLALSQKGELARAREWFLKAGNDAMADRMAQALQQSPIRGVADSAADALAKEQPFRPAVEEKPRSHRQSRPATC